MHSWPAVCLAFYASLAIAVGLPLGLGGCQVLLSQLTAHQEGLQLEATIKWKERDLARPLLDVQVRNIADDIVTEVAVACDFQDSMGVTIFRSSAFLRRSLQAGETGHLNANNFEALPRFERAKCKAEGV